MSKQIPLHDREGNVRAVTLVDAADYDGLTQRRWSLGTGGYAVRVQKVRGRQLTILMHRQIMGLGQGDGRVVDHRNHDTLDNRRRNLRVCTRSGNAHNPDPAKVPTGRAGVRGVSWCSQTGRWRALVQIEGRVFHLGRHATIEDAAAARAEFMARRREIEKPDEQEAA